VPSFTYTPLPWPLAFATAVPLALGAFTLRRRRVHAANAFLLLLLGISLWSSAYAAELAADNIRTKLLLYYAGYFGIVLLPGSWLIFAMEYTGRSRWWVGRHKLVLFLEPLAMLRCHRPPRSHGRACAPGAA
jgi:hypothetical protein